MVAFTETSDKQSAMQLAIVRRVHEFDLIALLRAIFHLGYQWDDLYFESSIGSQKAASLCHAVTFKPEGVFLSLNIGLLGHHSPLPSFFFKLMESNTVGGELFKKYLGFFDHHLLKNLLQASLIEKNHHLFPSWNTALHDYITLAGLDSLTTFSLLIQLIYPDFETNVKKHPKVIRIRESAFAVGGLLSYDSILGGNATKTYASFHVVLTTDDPCYKTRTPWPIEIRRRLRNYILPLLRRVEVHLALLLIIRGHEGRMEFSHSSYLGFEPLGKRTAPFKLLVFYGRAKIDTLKLWS